VTRILPIKRLSI